MQYAPIRGRAATDEEWGGGALADVAQQEV